MADRPLLVVDAPSLLYRAYYGLPRSITGADGRPVNALLGFANQVLWAVERHAPRAVVLCSGAEAATYRVEALPRYHADRPPVPDELAPQWADAPAFFGAFGWAWEDAGDLEADDLLGAYAECEVARRRDVPDLQRRPRHVPVRGRVRAACSTRAAAGTGRSSSTSRASRRSTGSGPTRSRTSSRCAATRATGSRARRASARRRRARSCASTATLEDGDRQRRQGEAAGRRSAPESGRRAARVPQDRDAAADPSGMSGGRSDHVRRRRSSRVGARDGQLGGAFGSVGAEGVGRARANVGLLPLAPSADASAMIPRVVRRAAACWSVVALLCAAWSATAIAAPGAPR